MRTSWHIFAFLWAVFSAEDFASLCGGVETHNVRSWAWQNFNFVLRVAPLIPILGSNWDNLLATQPWKSRTAFYWFTAIHLLDFFQNREYWPVCQCRETGFPRLITRVFPKQEKDKRNLTRLSSWKSPRDSPNVYSGSGKKCLIDMLPGTKANMDTVDTVIIVRTTKTPLLAAATGVLAP